MTPWRLVLTGIAGAAITAGFLVGPGIVRFILFWLCFFAVPGVVALRFFGVPNNWAYLAAGAVCGAIGFAGASYPDAPWQSGIVDAALIGALFGLGWKLIFNVADIVWDQQPPHRTMMRWHS